MAGIAFLVCCAALLVVESVQTVWPPGNARTPSRLLRVVREYSGRAKRSATLPSGLGHDWTEGKKDGGQRSPTDRAVRIARHALASILNPSNHYPPDYPAPFDDHMGYERRSYVIPPAINGMDIVMMPFPVHRGIADIILKGIAMTVGILKAPPDNKIHFFDDDSVNTMPECTASLPPNTLCAFTVIPQDSNGQHDPPPPVTVSPSAVGTTASPSVAGTTASPSVAGTTASPSAVGTTASPSVAGTTASPSVAGTTASPSVAGTTDSTVQPAATPLPDKVELAASP